MNNHINLKNIINMKTLKTFLLAIAVLATCSINAQVSITTDGSSADGSAMLEVKSTDKGFLPPRMTKEQRDAISTPATGLIIYQTDSVPGLYQYNGTMWTISSAASHYLGEEYLDGIIFYLYTESDGQQHGLIVSKTEASKKWSDNTSNVVGANRTEDGVYNMGLMPTNEGTARNWVESLGEGWYLPSVDELGILWHNRYHVNKTARDKGYTLLSNLTSGDYWSSTEHDDDEAFRFEFMLGYSSYLTKSQWRNVRAVKAF
ncbi:MAG: DUF1566 domain-containing protein [Clostridia bacterium]|nr:DUF1566 domain-containing protein [Clostridia bacterium]